MNSHVDCNFICKQTVTGCCCCWLKFIFTLFGEEKKKKYTHSVCVVQCDLSNTKENLVSFWLLCVSHCVKNIFIKFICIKSKVKWLFIDSHRVLHFH